MSNLGPLFSNSWVFIPIILWTIFWKGYALWTAVKRGQKRWFLVLLIINTFGILDIIYLFYVAKKDWGDVKSIIKRGI